MTLSLCDAQTDRYYMLKKQILETLGYYGDEAEFPVYADRMPTQLLAYLRLARVQDPGLLAKVRLCCLRHNLLLSSILTSLSLPTFALFLFRFVASEPCPEPCLA